MNILNLEEVKLAKEDIEIANNITEKVENLSILTNIDNNKKNKNMFYNLKNTVKKLINCCIE